MESVQFNAFRSSKNSEYVALHHHDIIQYIKECDPQVFLAEAIDIPFMYIRLCRCNCWRVKVHEYLTPHINAIMDKYSANVLDRDAMRDIILRDYTDYYAFICMEVNQ